MNIVFDLGGVVVAWRPEEILAAAFRDDTARDLARRHVMSHPDWLELDRGTMTFDEAIARGAERSGLSEREVRHLLESVPPALIARDETVDLMRRLHEGGHQLYCLSNMPADSIEYLERRYAFWHLFAGTVISSRIGHCKPEPPIYAHLIETYHLDPRDTLFIDDVPANLRAAESFGIRTILFRDAVQCEEELRQLGCL
jgi:putative hydrolase of the HAD superfamily